MIPALNSKTPRSHRGAYRSHGGELPSNDAFNSTA
jgi:hypothetical protein